MKEIEIETDSKEESIRLNGWELPEDSSFESEVDLRPVTQDHRLHRYTLKLELGNSEKRAPSLPSQIVFTKHPDGLLPPTFQELLLVSIKTLFQQGLILHTLTKKNGKQVPVWLRERVRVSDLDPVMSSLGEDSFQIEPVDMVDICRRLEG